MADPYLIFPGTDGNYVSTDDVNLLDADTAHIEQSVGVWGIGSGVTLSQSQDVTPHFGDYTLKAVTGDGVNRWWTTDGYTIPVDASTEVNVSAYFAAAAAYSTTASIRVRQYDSSEVIGTQTIHDLGAWPVGEVGQLATPAFTTDADAAWIRVDVYAVGTSVAGDTYYMDAVCVREGTDASFVPSLRIVGDLDLRVDAQPDNWSPASDHTFAYRSLVGQWNLRSASRFSVRHAGDSQTFTHGFTGSSRKQLRMLAQPTIGWTAQELIGGVWADYDDVLTPWTPVAESGTLVLGARVNGTAPLYAGDYYSYEARDGIDGPVVARFDAGEVPQPAQLPI